MISLNRQSGAVLVISLMILLVLTLLAVSTMTTSNFELIMATNTQSQAVSLANAEIAVSEGEGLVMTSYNPGPITLYIDPSTDDSAADGIYEYNSQTSLTPGLVSDTANITDFDWDGDDGFITGPSENKYVIEYMGGWTMLGASLAGGVNISTNSRYVYRLSGHGTSSRGGERLVQTFYLTE